MLTKFPNHIQKQWVYPCRRLDFLTVWLKCEPRW
jgi:hypothetical protein